MPLAVALLAVSNPTVAVMDMLSRLSHDSDQEVAQNAILALGMLLQQPWASAFSGATSNLIKKEQSILNWAILK